jgi:predicted O-methyltransferase YrrM
MRDLFRLRSLAAFVMQAFSRGIRWYFKSREYTNFTYEISPASTKYLGALLANVFRVPLEDVERYFSEVLNDAELAAFLERQVQGSPERYFADVPIRYGRRIGWYAMVRLLRPQVVVESGIDRGVGTCVLASAMLRNRREGSSGTVVAMDVSPRAGAFLAPPYSDVVRVQRGDSLPLLEALGQDVDLFIHDSDHSAVHERAEYEIVRPRLSKGGILVTDNAELTDTLFEFARAQGMEFWHWREEALHSVHAGGGIGLATFPRGGERDGLRR